MFLPLPRNGSAHAQTASFTVTRTAESTVVAVAGEVDLAVAGRFAALINQELRSSPRALLIDATELTFCAARGLTVLLDATADAVIAGVPFAICGRGRPLRRPIDVLGLNQALPLHSSTADALAWLAFLPG
ncbi:STAS domain-containing protein [Amycolatopsis sp. lyj-109]|uniref:STAS domain-containing protein n=1 Tax=Amycolatopsis sp. lyj-109 TaxID=2789287 RepID=UPI00397C0B11